MTYTLLYHEIYSVLGWIPLLPIDQISLLFLIWLQLPYFRGVECVCRLVSREIAWLLHTSGDSLKSPRMSLTATESSVCAHEGSGTEMSAVNSWNHDPDSSGGWEVLEHSNDPTTWHGAHCRETGSMPSNETKKQCKGLVKAE